MKKNINRLSDIAGASSANQGRLETMSHTPGPWHITPGQIPAESVWSESGSIRIASFVEGQNWQEAHANAYLIAAAPKLLEEAIAAEATLTLVSQVPDLPGHVFEQVMEDLTALRFAIAKARGETA